MLSSDSKVTFLFRQFHEIRATCAVICSVNFPLFSHLSLFLDNRVAVLVNKHMTNIFLPRLKPRSCLCLRSSLLNRSSIPSALLRRNLSTSTSHPRQGIRVGHLFVGLTVLGKCPPPYAPLSISCIKQRPAQHPTVSIYSTTPFKLGHNHFEVTSAAPFAQNKQATFETPRGSFAQLGRNRKLCPPKSWVRMLCSRFLELRLL